MLNTLWCKLTGAPTERDNTASIRKRTWIERAEFTTINRGKFFQANIPPSPSLGDCFITLNRPAMMYSEIEINSSLTSRWCNEIYRCGNSFVISSCMELLDMPWWLSKSQPRHWSGVGVWHVICEFLPKLVLPHSGQGLVHGDTAIFEYVRIISRVSIFFKKWLKRLPMAVRATRTTLLAECMHALDC